MLDHMLDRIAGAQIERNPYPHIIVDSVFPESVYEDVLYWFPYPHQMVHPESSHRVYENVYQCDLVPDPAVEAARDGAWEFTNFMKGRQKHFWSAFKAQLFSDRFVRALATKFAAQIQLIPDPPRPDQLYPVGRLAIDMESAGLSPHTDHRRKVVSVLFYLAKGGEDEEACGTQLFRARPGLEPSMAGQHYTWDDVDPESKKVARYVPNRMVAWAVTPDSLHAYHQTWSGPRRTIKYFLQRSDVDPDESAAELAETGATSRRAFA